jgi:hypothetical protein
MIELLVAYLFWEGDAPAQWWALFVVILLVKIALSWHRAKVTARFNEEADQVVKKLFGGQNE